MPAFTHILHLFYFDVSYLAQLDFHPRLQINRHYLFPCAHFVWKHLVDNRAIHPSLICVSLHQGETGLLETERHVDDGAKMHLLVLKLICLAPNTLVQKRWECIPSKFVFVFD